MIPQQTKVIRAYQLAKGDFFIMQGLRYKVLDIEPDRIKFAAQASNNYGSANYMGISCQARVELIQTTFGDVK